MAITQADFEEMEIAFNRLIRTDSSEQYLILSSDPEAGSELHKDAPHESRVGHIIVQYVSGQLSRPFVNGLLVLEADWEGEAAQSLISKIDYEIVSSLGAGSYHRRQTFEVEIFIGESVGGTTDRVEDDSQRGLYGVHKQFSETQEMINRLPESLSETIYAAVDEQYQEIEEIIESDLDEQEKKERLRDKMEMGLERGLPTFMYRGDSN